MTDRFLDSLAEFCLRRSKLILILAFGALILAVGGATRLHFDPELLNLIPQNDREVNEFRKVITEMGTIDYHIVVLQIPPGHELSEYDALIENIAAGFRNSPLVQEVQYRIPNPLDLIRDVLPHSLLLLPPQDLPKVAEAISPRGIDRAMERNRALLQTPQSFAVKTLVQWDPFNLLPIFLSRFQSAGSGFKLDISSGYYLSSDHSTLLVLVKPKKPAQDIGFARKLMAETETIERDAVRKFSKEAAAGTTLPTIEYTGGYAIAFNDAELIKSDIIANVLFSFFGVLALFIYAFRRTMSIAYAGIPMSLAIALTFGLAGVVYGTLSSASAGFAALVAGLGIDFITVLYGRYVDERNRGAEMREAIHVIMRRTLPGVSIAAATTAATFYAFLSTKFRGMTQLGFLTGSGILIFFLCVIFVLPALLRQTEGTKRQPKLYLHSFGSEHLIEMSLRSPRPTIIAWIVLIVVCGLLAMRIQFSDNIQNLRAAGNRGIILQELLKKKFGQSFDFMMFVVEAPTLDSTLEKTYQTTTDLNSLVRQGTIASFQSIATFVPPPSQQHQVIEALTAGENDQFSARRVREQLQKSATDAGFRPDVYDEYLDLFTPALNSRQPISLADLQNKDLAQLTSRFLKKTSAGYMSVTYIYPVGGAWPRQVPPPLLQVAKNHPGSILTGVNLVSETLRNIIRSDALWSTLLGFVIVLGLLIIGFRSVTKALLIFVPFIAGAVVMLGGMATFGAPFNLMNVFVGLMLVGVATDYAVYMMQRYLEDPAGFRSNAPETAKAVVMAAMTAIVGFGSFAISHYPGLRSIGYASTFGIGFSALAAITLLPAILVLHEQRTNTRKGGASTNAPQSD
ncbi:MAG: MMPL family transporter [Acidobacteriota bacterium]